MKYYVSEVTTFVDGAKDSLGMYTYDDKNSAIASYHTKMGGAMRNANCKSETLLVFSAEAVVYVQDKFKREETEGE